MFNNTIQTRDLLRILGYEALWKLDHVCRLQQLIREVAIRHRYEVDDQEDLNELTNAAITVPRNYVASARNKCISLLERITEREIDETDDEENMIEYIVQKKNTTSQFQNRRVNVWARNRKPRSRGMMKKNVHAPSQKFIKSQSNKFQSNGRKKFRYARYPNSDKTSESDMEEVEAKRLPRRRKLKKKTEVKKQQSCLSSDDESSLSVEMTSVNETEPTKDMQSIYDSNSVNKIQIKPAVVKLIDFMNDSSADNDEYIAQYKQSYGYKDDNEYEILDEVEGDGDLDQMMESDPNFDNNDDENDNEEDRISVKSHKSQDHDKDLHSALSKSIASEEFNSKLP